MQTKGTKYFFQTSKQILRKILTLKFIVFIFVARNVSTDLGNKKFCFALLWEF